MNRGRTPWRAAAALLCAMMGGTAAHAVPIVQFDLPGATPMVGGDLAVDVTVFNAVDLYAYSYSITFNPAVVQLVSESRGTFIWASGTYTPGSVDNTAGTYSSSMASQVAPAPGITGSGTLEHLTFRMISGAPTTFAFNTANTTLYDSHGVPIAFTAFPVTVKAAVPEPASVALWMLGLTGLWARRARRR